ncbi:sensor histidine kinase [Streptomyces deserti]
MVLHAVARARLPRGRAADAALAGGLFVLVAVGSLRSLIGERAESWPVTALGWALMAAACGALYLRRRHPVAVAGSVLAATIAYYLVSVYDGPLMVAFVVALYAVAAEGRLRAAVVLAALTVLLTGTGTLLGNHDVNGVALFMLTGWLVGVVALGWVRHNRLALAREAEQRAASEERLRIARELHDVVGHHISLINVQSAAALRRLRKDPDGGPERAEQALGAIKEASREALRELRATLGVLRQADEAAPTAPTAGLDRLGELVESARLAGLQVHVHTDGDHRPLPAEVDLAAYRIVQESLTNVTRHAHATAVTVRTERGSHHVTVEITDNGRGPARPTGTLAGSGITGSGITGSGVTGSGLTGSGITRSGITGSGITGMRERARALGGDLTVGPGPDGGFTVRARLPCRNLPRPNGALHRS